MEDIVTLGIRTKRSQTLAATSPLQAKGELSSPTAQKHVVTASPSEPQGISTPRDNATEQQEEATTEEGKDEVIPGASAFVDRVLYATNNVYLREIIQNQFVWYVLTLIYE